MRAAVAAGRHRVILNVCRPLQRSRRRSVFVCAAGDRKVVWVQTSNQQVMTAALESGLSDTFVFAHTQKDLATEWEGMARIQPVFIGMQGPCNVIVDRNENQVGRWCEVSSPEEIRAMEALIETDGTVVMDSTTWQVIPAENLVAAFSSDNAHATLLATVTSSDSAETMLGALEVGTDGVVLRTESPEEARRLAKVMQERHAATRPTFELHTAVVTRVEAAGVGDRVCVDTCSVLHPGEGLLVGSFARTMFLVHSECAESAYVASRPFRINAGPVHSYLVGGGGKTRYLSELCTGEQVPIVDPLGNQRMAVIGRIKIEERPLLLVEAETADGMCHSILLQNAETVRLVGPSSGGEDASGWRAISVAELRAGDPLFVHSQPAARHTGIEIDERIVER